MFTTWCFKLEKKVVVHWLVESYVHKEWCGGFELLMEIARDGQGFFSPGGLWLHVGKYSPPLRPFLIWISTENKELRCASAQIGMVGSKDYVQAFVVKNLRWELEKWDPHSERTPAIPGASSSRRKRGKPKGAKKKTGRTLWIGFPP
ncbi:hypothetical protein SUGI_1019090 [Cryptomeria japonica]|nr:hypothetical protein SUGI_1019090 [Cryptomeria japonica]